MSVPLSTATAPTVIAPVPQSEPVRFAALAWLALACGVAGLTGASFPALNTLTAILAGTGVVVGLVALLGTRRLLALLAIAACVAGIMLTSKFQQDALARVNELGRSFQQQVNQGGPQLDLATLSPKTAG